MHHNKPALTVTALFDTRVSGQPREAASIRAEVEAAQDRGFVRITGRTAAVRYQWCGQSRLSLRMRDPKTRRRVNLVFAMGQPRLEKAAVNIRPSGAVVERDSPEGRAELDRRQRASAEIATHCDDWSPNGMQSMSELMGIA